MTVLLNSLLFLLCECSAGLGLSAKIVVSDDTKMTFWPRTTCGVGALPCSICLHAGLFVETVHPAFSTSDLDVKRRRHTTLKRLDFVRAYTEYYWSKANTIASMVRSCLFSLTGRAASTLFSTSRASCPCFSCNVNDSLRLPTAENCGSEGFSSSLKATASKAVYRVLHSVVICHFSSGHCTNYFEEMLCWCCHGGWNFV